MDMVSACPVRLQRGERAGDFKLKQIERSTSVVPFFVGGLQATPISGLSQGSSTRQSAVQQALLDPRAILITAHCLNGRTGGEVLINNQTLP